MSGKAVLQCVGLIAKTGERCTLPAKPGSRRCRFHTTVPPERARCQHTWGNGNRCEGQVPTARIGVEEVCGQHRRPCTNPDCHRMVGLLNGLCHSCAARLARDAAAVANEGKPRKTHRERWEATFGGLPRCVEMSAESGQPCSREAVGDSQRCGKHQDIPVDEERCTFTWENGKRCPRRFVAVKTRRCTHHRVATKTGRPVKGEEPVFRPCRACGKPSKGALGCADHAPACAGTTAAGEPCGRLATVEADGMAFCKTHALRPITPPPPPLKGPAPKCGMPSGQDGQPCEAGATIGGDRCWKHATLPGEDDRCLHLYAGGDRCPSRSRKAHGHGHGTMCARHTVPCREDGCDRPVSDTLRQLCPEHAPRCEATVPTGEQCALPAVPGSAFCGPHEVEPEEPRCQWIHKNATRCRNALPPMVKGGNVWRDLCDVHVVECGAEGGCDRMTAFADGLCLRHRPHCDAEGCKRPALAGDLCWKHHAVFVEGLCSLLTGTGEPCQNPAALETDADGRICSQHNTTMPPDEARCGHLHPTGERCALSVQEGTLFCGVHAPAHSTRCAWKTPAGERCGKPVVPRPEEPTPTCETHRRLPEGDARCLEVLEGGQQCPASRLGGTDRCVMHARRVPCGVVAPSGEPCGRSVIVRIGRGSECRQHRVLPSAAHRCKAEVATGVQCPAAKTSRRDYCVMHADQQPQCMAVDDRDVRCRSYAPSGKALCDRHAFWFPGQSHDRPEEFQAFFVRPRADLMWEIVNAHAAEAIAVLETEATIIPRNPGMGETGVDELDDLIAIDPFDLTGARRSYLELVQDGMGEADALRAALLVSKRYSPNTLKGLTKQLRPYLEWCRENSCVPMPASRTTIMRFLVYLTTRGRVWDGQPLSSGTMLSFRKAITQAHIMGKEPDPFEQHPELGALLKGYDRLYAKPQVQAHAIRIDELAALIATATCGTPTSLREVVIATVITDPEVGMSFAESEKWLWENTAFVPGQDTKVSIWKGRATSPTRNDLIIPNRAAAVATSGQDFPLGEMPLEARMCGTASLQALAAERMAKGLPLTGPVLCKEDGTALTKQGILKSVASMAGKAGLDYSPTYAFDDRVRLVEAIGAPSIIGLRDAAVMALSWWASLRRSEVSALDVGDIGKDARDRGLVILVKKGKGDVHGQFVPVPYARDGRGNLLPTDASRALHRWLAAYAQHLGRELTKEDPLFINVKRNDQQRLGEKGVSEIVSRYAQAAGIHAELGERISSHGFRAGYATEWLATGRPSEPLAKRQRRKSTQSLLGYFRLADPFEDGLAFSMDVPDEVFDIQKLKAQMRQQGEQI